MTELLQRDVALQSFNTMALPAKARWYARVENLAGLRDALTFAQNRQLPVVVLGGGSNTLFADDLEGLLLHIALRGTALLEDFSDSVLVRVAAGEEWDGFLRECLMRNWYGLENLALIPGTVGAAPVQNIGAYGQEVAACIEQVHILDRQTLAESTLSRADCRFGYRSSIFQQVLRQSAVITAVDFRLQKTFQPNLSYPALAAAVKDIPHPTAALVRNAVIAIRTARLPDPARLPNAGSFFRNPVVSAQRLEELRAKWPQIPSFPQAEGSVKLAAAWLIEQSGWKGRRLGPVGMHDQQALVLVNHGGATYADVEKLAREVSAAVFSLFAVRLEPEPVIACYSVGSREAGGAG
jgi:UDP-N-acetylmuramate dehydrogenase